MLVGGGGGGGQSYKTLSIIHRNFEEESEPNMSLCAYKNTFPQGKTISSSFPFL